ncbi:MAG: transcriptional repressor [Xanthomonadaceae bacterium]|jgi:Fur family zinc uptake transcriptional regulator|nr:transcriptional repressor [Xanthomonadaceae bacterium]
MAKPKPRRKPRASAFAAPPPAPLACLRPEHHAHGGSDCLRRVEQVCRERGLNLTPIRTEALRHIVEAGRPIKAYDLLERMRGGPGASAPPTVYRALDFLLEHGFIHRLASVNAFLACHHPAEGHVVPILICRDCEAAEELEDEAVSTALEQLAAERGFQSAHSHIEVLGRCARCTAGSVR